MTPAVLDSEIADRISMIRYPMIFFIVVAHIDPGRSYIADPGALNFLVSFAADGVVRVTVSTLTCISGFLIFHKSLDRDVRLLVLALFAPLVGLVIRRAPYLGLVASVAIFAPDLDGPLILNDAMFVTFYLGGMASIRRWNVRRLDRYALLLIGALVVACCVFATLAPVGPFWLRIAAPFLVWPVFSLLAGTRVGAWLGAHARASIFLFMVHGVLVLILRAGWPELYGGEVLFLVWLATPLGVALVSQAAYLALVRLAPNVLTFLLGGRRSATR